MSSSASSDSGYWPECVGRGGGRASTSLHSSIHPSQSNSIHSHNDTPWRHSTSSLRMRTSKRSKRKKITSISSLPPPSSTSLSPSLSPSPSSSPPPSHPPSLLSVPPFGVVSPPTIPSIPSPSDEHIICVYLGIRQVIGMLRREKSRWEKVLSMSRHEDGRWGGMRRERVDPRGALVPPIYPTLSNTSVAACWATPHPVVVLGLLCCDMNEYLAILRRLYPAATSIVCGMDGRGGGERKREEKEISQPSTPNETEISFSHSSSIGCMNREGEEGRDEMDGSTPISVKAFHNGIPVPPIHTEMREMSCISSSTSSSSITHQTPIIPSGGGPLTSIPTPSQPTTVSTSTPPPTVSSALPSTMVAHPQRSQEALFRASSSSSRHQYHHHPPPSHIQSTIASSISCSTNSMHHSQQRNPNFIQHLPANVMEQSDENAARMAVNGGGINGHRKEEGVSSRSPYLSSSHPSVWSTATIGGSGGVGESVGSLPPRAPPSGFVDEGGRYTISEMDYLSEEIWHYHNTMTQTESTLSRKLHLRDMLYYAICPVFPMCGLYIVGSSLNGFGNNSSDMDLCLMITNKDLDQKKDAVVVLNMILTQLATVEWVAHQQLILAKVPILRIQFTSPFGDITVDLNANNSVAIKNTHLLCYYSTFDWRVRPLVTIVKEWAKKKGINDANRSSFTSYSLVLMVIHYLQCGLDQPVLPSLQSMYARRFSRTADVRSLNVAIPLSPPPEEWSFNDTSSLGELLIGFLEYFALKFDYDQHAISVRMGKKLDRTVVVRMRGQFTQHTNNWRSQWRCVCIEEPFTYSNTAHSVYDEMVFTKIKEAFKDAYNELEVHRDLNKLMNCTPINVPNLPYGNGAVVYMGGSIHADTSVVASSSSSSLSTPHSGHASSASSSCGEDEVVIAIEKREDESHPSPSSSPPIKKEAHLSNRSNQLEMSSVVSTTQ